MAAHSEVRVGASSNLSELCGGLGNDLLRERSMPTLGRVTKLWILLTSGTGQGLMASYMEESSWTLLSLKNRVTVRFIFYVYGCCASMYVCVPRGCLVPTEVRRGHLVP